MPDINKLQEKLCYSFKNVDLLKQALTHRSYSKLNYERLEFVGDGILDYVVAINLYHKYPNVAEGDLSKMRAGLVNQDSLVAIAICLNLGSYLFLENGEEKTGGRGRPSILADSLEAIFAAICLDSDFQNAKVVIEQLYEIKFTTAETLLTKDSKSLLQEYLQEKKINVPSYNVIDSTGPDHNSVFKVECKVPELEIKVVAEGKTKKEAGRLAAEKILYLIKEKNVE